MPKAVRLDHCGGTEVLRDEEVYRLAPGSGEALVRAPRGPADGPGGCRGRESGLPARGKIALKAGQADGLDLA